MYAQLISDAEAFLAAHPIGCSLSDEERDQATDLADMLAAYNEGEDSSMTVLTYTVVVTNCGNVELYNVKVYDSLLDQWFFLCDFGDGTASWASANGGPLLHLHSPGGLLRRGGDLRRR
jgi:hypothetical protein